MILGCISQLASLVTKTDTIYECRHCGITVDEQTRTCPECGSEEIAQYPLS